MRTAVLVHGAVYHDHHRIVLSSVVRRDSEDERTEELRMTECTQTLADFHGKHHVDVSLCRRREVSHTSG